LLLLLLDDDGEMLDDDDDRQDAQQVETQCFDYTQQQQATTNSLMTRADEIEKGINQMLALMNEKRASKVKDVTVAVTENIVKTRDELTSDKYRVLLANKIAELGGGPTIMEYLHFLRDQGLEVDDNFQCFYIVLSALWNETEDSMKLSMPWLRTVCLNFFTHS
jgi:hypothetical protein